MLSGLKICLEKPLDGMSLGSAIDLLNDNGMTWEANLKKGRTTHVVSEEWNPSRRSFKQGSKPGQGIAFAKTAWLRACITAGKAVPVEGDFVLSSPKARKSATKRNRKAIEVKTQQVNANKRKRKASKSVGSGDALSTALAAANASPTEETNPPRTKGAPGYDSVFTIQLFEEGVPNIKHQRNGALMAILGEYLCSACKQDAKTSALFASLPYNKKKKINGKKVTSAIRGGSISVGKTKVLVPAFPDEIELPASFREKLVTGLQEIVREYQTAWELSN